MRPDELPNSYYNRINEAVEMVKSRGVDVESERTYTEQAKVLRMVKGLDPVRFGAHLGSRPKEGPSYHAKDHVGSATTYQRV
jgi:hypothetical protein